MATETLTAQNSHTLVQGPTNRSGAARFPTKSDSPIGAVHVLQVEGVDGEYISIEISNSVTGALAANLTGPSQTGWIDVPCAKSVQVKRTDNTGGDSHVELLVNT